MNRYIVQIGYNGHRVGDLIETSADVSEDVEAGWIVPEFEAPFPDDSTPRRSPTS